MFQQMIYRICSAARKQLCASGQDIIAGGEIVCVLNALTTVTTVLLHGNTRDGMTEIWGANHISAYDTVYLRVYIWQ